MDRFSVKMFASAAILILLCSSIPISYCSITSTITITNNEITYVEPGTPSMGLYKDIGCYNSWNTAAFNEGIIEVTKGNTEITVLQETVDLSGDGKAYLRVSNLESFDLSVGIRCSNSSGIVILDGMDISLISSTGGEHHSFLEWNDITSGTTFTGLTSSVYEIILKLDTKEGDYPLSTIRSFTFDVFFEITTESGMMIWNNDNQVKSSDNVKGITINTGDHNVQGPLLTPPSALDGLGDTYSIVQSNGEHFATGGSATAEIISDASSPFIICLDRGNNQNSLFTVQIKATYVDDSGVSHTISKSETIVKQGQQYKYIGIVDNAIVINNGSVGDLKPFKNMDVNITITGTPQGNTSVDLFFVVVE